MRIRHSPKAVICEHFFLDINYKGKINAACMSFESPIASILRIGQDRIGQDRTGLYRLYRTKQFWRAK